MIRLTLFEDAAESTREFPVDVVTIGRSHDNVLEIKETSISRLHCEIALIQGRAMLVNHARTNGTLVNGRPVGEAILKPGDEIFIGRVKIRFDAVSAEGSAAPPVTTGSSSSTGLRKKHLHRRRRD